jgi:hypothetical protein
MDLVFGLLVHLDPGFRLFGQVENLAWVGVHPQEDIIYRQSSLIHSG